MDKLTHYQQSILEITGCKPEEASEIEEIMRETILHSTLDWLSKEQFKKTALEAQEVHQEIKRYNELSHKLFNKEYFLCSESEFRQIELALTSRIVIVKG